MEVGVRLLLGAEPVEWSPMQSDCDCFYNRDARLG